MHVFIRHQLTVEFMGVPILWNLVEEDLRARDLRLELSDEVCEPLVVLRFNVAGMHLVSMARLAYLNDEDEPVLVESCLLLLHLLF